MPATNAVSQADGYAGDDDPGDCNVPKILLDQGGRDELADFLGLFRAKLICSTTLSREYDADFAIPPSPDCSHTHKIYNGQTWRCADCRGGL